MSGPRPSSVIPVSASDSVADVAAKIDSSARSVVLILGDSESPLGPQVRSVLSRCVLPIVRDAKSVIVDNGGKAGTAAELGESLLEDDAPPTAVGITTSTDFEPNHSFIIQLQQSDPIKWTFQFAAALAKSGTPEQKPVLLIVFGGQSPEMNALVRAARLPRGWPVVLIGGTGGISNQILQAMKPPPTRTTPAPITDPLLREIVETAVVDSFDINEDVDDLKRILSAQLQKTSERRMFRASPSR